jgi:hypothetical protein
MSSLRVAKYTWKEVSGGLGMTATEREIRNLASPYNGFTGMIIDDPLNDDAERASKRKKDYNTVGVRYLRGHNLQKAYTYRVRKGAKLYLGQEIVVPTELDGYVANTIAVVVELHKKPQDNGPYNYKFVVGTVKPI